jgi:TRAP transporter 4TM/12TM fusion protein
VASEHTSTAPPGCTPEPSAARLADELEYGPRRLQGLSRALVWGLAGLWSVFQFSLPCFLTLSSDLVRAVHLTFAIVLVFLSFPTFRGVRIRRGPGFLRAVDRIPTIDLLLAVLAGLSAAYYALDYVGISGRQGTPILRDYVLGGMLVVLLLEAARRALGPALPTIAALFLVVGFFGEKLPAFMAFKRISVNQLVNQLTMSTEGIYGVPLYVSATTVYLFVLFGAMLEKSGAGRYFVELAFALVGRFRGGPAKAAVLASGLTGLVSGSSIANTVTTGTFTIPLMKKAGYPAEKAAAVEVAASTNGQLMPPIMGAAAFIIAEKCGMQYLEVVRAAFIPAIISYLALIYITHLEACKLGLRGLAPEDLPRFWKTFRNGLHFLILLIVLLLLRFSPEYAAFWAIVALAALIVVRDLIVAALKGNPLHKALLEAGQCIGGSLVAGGRAMMGIGVAVAAAGIIVGVMTLGPGGLVVSIVAKLSGGHILPMLFITAVCSLILGMGLPTTANYIVMATITVPVIVELSADAGVAIPLIAANLFCFFFGILADDTPPVGLAAYAASAIAKSRPFATGVQGFVYDMRTAILPFFFVFNTDLLLLDVHAWWRVVLIFFTALLAMFAFAALTQRYLLTRNSLLESLALVGVVAVLMRPGFFVECLPALSQSTLPWYGVGVLLYTLVIALQVRRRARQGPAAGAALTR